MVHVFLLSGASPRRVETRWARKIEHMPSHGNSLILAVPGQVGKLPKYIARTKIQLAAPDRDSGRDTADATRRRNSNRFAQQELEDPHLAGEAASRISTGDRAKGIGFKRESCAARAGEFCRKKFSVPLPQSESRGAAYGGQGGRQRNRGVVKRARPKA